MVFNHCFIHIFHLSLNQAFKKGNKNPSVMINKHIMDVIAASPLLLSVNLENGTELFVTLTFAKTE